MNKKSVAEPMTPSQIKNILVKRAPEGLILEDIITAFSYNLNNDNEITDGVIIFSDGFIYKFEKDKFLLKLDIKQTEAFTYRPLIGAAEICYTLNGMEFVLCRSDNSMHELYSKNTRRLERYRESGEYTDDDKLELIKVCPKCGRPFARGTSVCTKCVNKRTMFKRLWQIAAPYKGYLILSVVLFFIAFGISLLGPYVNKILVDNYITDSGKTELLQAGRGSEVIWGFLFVILLTVLVYAGNYAAQIFRNLAVMEAGTKFIVDLRRTVFEKIQMMSIATISKRTSGELMKRVTGDTAQLENFIVSQLPNIIQQLLLLIAVGTILFIYDWKLALMIILPMPVCMISMQKFWRYIHKIYHRQWVAESRSSSVLYDIFSGIRVVKAFRVERKENERYDNAILNERDISVKNEVTYNYVSPFIGFIMNIGTFFLLYYTGAHILGGDMTLGEASMFSGYVSLIYGPIRWLAMLPRMLTRAMTSMVKVFDVLDEKVDVGDKADAIELDINGDIEFDNVSFGYDEGGDVLKNISLKIKKGDMVGIVGKSGVGKSTLINLIMRLYDTGSGSIKIDGHDIRDISQHSLRSQTGVVLQETFLFKGTVYDNIAYANPGCTKEQVLEASIAAGAHQFIMKLPDAYNTIVGEKGHTLSGGERQRVAIARALLHDPKILILDEATASLDTETEKSIQDTLQKLIADRTTIAIAHRLSTLRNATYLVVLDKGRVAEVGTHDELIKKQGIYHGLVMAQRQMSKMAKAQSAGQQHG